MPPIPMVMGLPVCHSGACRTLVTRILSYQTVRSLLFSFFLMLRLASVPAQSPSYVHYGVSEGLPSNKVYCAMQDYRGFIWFGTDKGLARFDGTRFQVYSAKDGLPDPEVLNLFEDSQHRLWISCFGQKPCYMLNGRLFTAKNDSLLAQINTEPGLWEFSEDPKQRVWITCRSNTAFVLDRDTILAEVFPQSISQVRQIGALKFGLGTLSVIQKDIGLFYDLKMAKNIFRSAAISNNHILYAFVNELILLEWINGRILELDRIENTGGRLFTDKKGGFWLCPDSKGAICFSNPRRDLSNPVLYLPDEKVNAMLEDKHGTLWFCTSGHGVYLLSPGKAATYTTADGLTGNNITALARSSDGQISAGDDIGNLYKISGKNIQKISLDLANDYNRCRQIIALPGDTCWVANDKGLYYETGSTIRKISSFQRTFSGLKTILATQGKIWYGNHHSVGFISPDRQEPVLMVNRRTTALGQDADRNIWAGRLDGLYSQRDSFQYNWGDRFPALKSRIVAIQDAGANMIWIVTTDSGLLLGTVNNGALSQVQTINQYLKRPIENIQSIYYEPATTGRVWMATNSGVYGLNPVNWDVVHFDKHDGLADDDVNCVLVEMDTLWAGTVAGLSYLPLALQGNHNDFGTFVSAIHYQSGGRALSLNLLDSLSSVHRIILPPDAAMVTLNLAGLNYRSQGNLIYECITVNSMPPMRWLTRHNLFNWIKNGFNNKSDTTFVDGNSINFGIYFPAGSYQIKITAITAQGTYSAYCDIWTIIMQPYWYSTLWFDLLIWGLVVFALWRALRARTDYRKLSVAVSELQLQALQSQINPHFVGNSINAIQQFFYPPNPAAASGYIELFTRLLRRTIILSEQHFNKFEEELAYDRDYLKMIQLRFGDRFLYDVRGAETISGNMPFPSMLLQPILENATIHGLAPEGVSHLILQFSYSGKRFRCSVTDNGMGYKASINRHTTKPAEQKSKGLELLRKKVIAFNKLYDIGLRLDITDLSEAKSPGVGTCVVIEFYPEKINKNTSKIA